MNVATGFVRPWKRIGCREATLDMQVHLGIQNSSLLANSHDRYGHSEVSFRTAKCCFTGYFVRETSEHAESCKARLLTGASMVQCLSNPAQGACCVQALRGILKPNTLRLFPHHIAKYLASYACCAPAMLGRSLHEYDSDKQQQVYCPAASYDRGKQASRAFKLSLFRTLA
jgi:hypothetical protein